MPARSSRLVVVGAVVMLAACDVGDGTTLRDPVAETTLPPPDTTPLETEPLDDPALDDAVLDDPALDGESGLESVPTSTPTTSDADDPTDDDPTDTGLRIFTPWADGGPIDVAHTCDGADSSPALSWSGLPAGTREVAVSLVDESNLSNGRPFIHWVLSGIDSDVDRIGAGEVPPGAARGLNFFGDVGYTGPCPDPGTTGTFTLTVFALDQQLELADGTPAAELLDVIATVALDSTRSTGTVTR